MSRLDENLGAVDYDGLINQCFPTGDVFAVALRAGQGILKRGSALALSSGTAGKGDMVLLGTEAATDEALAANCILADDADTGTASGAAVNGIAYRVGHFNRNALAVKQGYTMTKADEEDLRKGGILLDDAI